MVLIEIRDTSSAIDRQHILNSLTHLQSNLLRQDLPPPLTSPPPPHALRAFGTSSQRHALVTDGTRDSDVGLRSRYSGDLYLASNPQESYESNQTTLEMVDCRNLIVEKVFLDRSASCLVSCYTVETGITALITAQTGVCFHVV